eukprot:8818871-Pyramimonas_sp.AAC.1
MADDDVNIIALQEIRQQSSHPRWIINIAKKAGFSCACSAPPPSGSRVAVMQGGTASLWRPRAGRAT